MTEIILNTKQKIMYFAAIFLSGLIINCVMLKHHFAIDSYDFIYNLDHKMFEMSANGRILIKVFVNALAVFGLDVMKFQSSFTFISILIMSFATYVILDTFLFLKPNSTLKERVIVSLSALFIIFNPFGVDLLLFSYMTFFTSIDILLITLCVNLLVKNWSIKNIFISMILVSSALLFYQGWGGLFVPLLLIFKYYQLKEAPIKRLISTTILSTGIYLFACIINLLFIKKIHPLFYDKGTDRTSNKIDILQNVKNILQKQTDIWLLHDRMLPSFFFFIIIILLSCVIFYNIFTKSNKNVLRYSLMFALIFVLLIGLTFSPHLVTSTTWVIQRSIMPISAIPGLLVLFSIFFIKDHTKYSKVQNLVLGISIIFLVVLGKSTINITIDNISTNKIDEQIGRMIISKIEKYERETGQKVSKLSFTKDTYPTWSYPDVIVYGDMNVRAFIIDWAAKSVITHVSGRTFESTIMDEEIFNQKFKDRDWGELLLEEQMVIKGNTAYIALY
ncbi:hypothetical protein J2T17_005556 [Paenibacillus mucilaginosus]|uniref:glucosyltransferase domain-containing protein n=1 Tax=Paenibacillus mucilaginosus TaxID=61624 RepID=UPI003D1CC56B